MQFLLKPRNFSKWFNREVRENILKTFEKYLKTLTKPIKSIKNWKLPSILVADLQNFRFLYQKLNKQTGSDGTRENQRTTPKAGVGVKSSVLTYDISVNIVKLAAILWTMLVHTYSTRHTIRTSNSHTWYVFANPTTLHNEYAALLYYARIRHDIAPRVSDKLKKCSFFARISASA